MSSPDTGSRWRQVSLWCNDWQAAEQMAIAHLGPQLMEAQNAEIITSWWFVRKGASWRVRCLPAPSRHKETVATLDQAMQDLAADGAIKRWIATIYEPEIHAFGGAAAIGLAHNLFHADSRHLLEHLRQPGNDHRRELGLLLGSGLIRAAGQDWYEQGDIWARVAAHRLTSPPALSETTAEAVHRLITARSHSTTSPLTAAPEWPAAFERTGQDLADLAHQGSLTRGLRAVLAHHILFAWNRAGIPTRQQALLAATATKIVFEQETTGPPGLICGLAGVPPFKVSTVTTDATSLDPAQLRVALTDHIRRLRTFKTPQVEAAFLTVPRHLFLPGVDPKTAYAPQVVVTKRADDGTAISSASSPNVVATMLEQLDVQPGHRVLEIGAATGINAALLAELVGTTGEVVTIEIDDDLTAGARTGLAAAGYDQVKVICADGAEGYSAAAPYDRIIVTAGAWDLVSAWWQQLKVGGRIVIPVRLHGSGLTRSIAFDFEQPGQMVSSSAKVCGFVPMRGASTAQGGCSVQVGDDVVLNLDADDLDDEAALRQALTHPAHEHWTGVKISDGEPVEHLDLWLATATNSRFARLSAGADARKSGLVTPALRWAGAALYDGGGTLAYLALRPQGSESTELAVIAHGPDSEKFAAQSAALLRRWSSENPTQPNITAHPADSPDDRLARGHHIARPDTRLNIVW